MLKRLTKLASISRPTLQAAYAPARGFCIYAAYLDPKAHVTMSHNPQNVYEDIIMLGDYLMPGKEMTKVDSQRYVPQIVQILFTHLNERYPEAKLNAEKFEDLSFYDWKDLGIDIDLEKFDLISKLSEELFIKEHKMRYPIEQSLRLSYTSAIFSELKLADYRLGFFVELYNSWLNLSIDRSHLFRSPKVKGDLSFLERYYADQDLEPKGVESLQRNTPENKTFINRLMNYIHS